jgi:TolA-binding protein
MRVLLALVAAVSLGCVAPRVNVDTRGLRPTAQETGPSHSSGSAPSGVTSAESQELKKELVKVEKKVDNLEGTVKKLDERLKKVEKKSN